MRLQIFLLVKITLTTYPIYAMILLILLIFSHIPINRYCNDTHSSATGTAERQSDEFVPKLFNDAVLCAGDEVRMST